MPIKLFVDHASQPAMAVLTTAKLKKIDFEQVKIDLFTGQHMTEDYAKINPFKKVPYMVDTDKNISTSESHTIMRYLCKASEESAHLYPLNDLAAVTKVDQYLDFHHLGVRLHLSDYVYHTIFLALFGKFDQNFDIEGKKAPVKQALTFFQNVFLQDKDFIAGSKVSIADFSAYFEINHLKLVELKFSEWKRLDEWMKRLQNQTPVLLEYSKQFQEQSKGFLGKIPQELMKKFII